LAARCCLPVCPFLGTAPADIYTLALHDALPIWIPGPVGRLGIGEDDPRLGIEGVGVAPDVEVALGRSLRSAAGALEPGVLIRGVDRKSTRLNSSHVKISYAVFCLKKKPQGRAWR